MYLWDTHLKVVEVLENPEIFNRNTDLMQGIIRTNISRMYYVCYHKLKEVLELNDIDRTLKSNDSHEYIIAKILQCKSDNYDNEDLKLLKKDLDELKGMRNEADYKVSANYPETRYNYIKSLFHDVYEKLSNF